MVQGNDKRLVVRRRTILEGKIFDDGGTFAECTVFDLSTTGARVKSDNLFEGRDAVNLKIARLPNIQRSEIVWRRNGQLGLRFANEIKRVPDSMVGLDRKSVV